MHIHEFDTKHRLFQEYMQLKELHDREGHAIRGERDTKHRLYKEWAALEVKHSLLTNSDPYEHNYNTFITKKHQGLVTKYAGLNTKERDGSFDQIEEQRLLGEIQRVAQMQHTERNRPRPSTASTKIAELCNLLDTCDHKELIFMHEYITNAMFVRMQKTI
jgi:transcription initiation factor TFIID subunit TAF12